MFKYTQQLHKLSTLRCDRWAKLSQKPASFVSCAVMVSFGSLMTGACKRRRLREYICSLFERVGGSSSANSATPFSIIL